MKHFDIFGNELPRWVSRLAPESCTASNYCLTHAQLLHLGIFGACKPIQFVNLTSSVDWCCACLTQCRPHKYIHERRGEEWNTNITAPYLSINGKNLTNDTLSIQKLDEHTQYLLPFWITEKEVFQLSRCLPEDFTTYQVGQKFSANSEIIVNSRGKRIPVVNIQEVISPHSKINLFSFLSLFRLFEPVSVRTRQAFSSSVSLQLRVECWRTRCWCSIWGTKEDFDHKNDSCLEGALSVNVFTKHGNELLLTNALRTSNAAEVYRRTFPESHPTFFC